MENLIASGKRKNISKVESKLKNQLLRLDHYKQYFEQQNDTALVERLANLVSATTKDLEIIEKCAKESGKLPETECETVDFTAIPINLDVKEKELSVLLQAKNLGISDALIYVIAEFFFPPSPNETIREFCSRKLKEFSVQPSSIFTNCFSKRQVDKTFSTEKITDPVQELSNTTSNSSDNEATKNTTGNNNNNKTQACDTILFEPALSFFIDKGRSKTFKRKFKPLKLTFWKKGCLYDDMLGTVQFKIDDVNDSCTLDLKAPLKRRLLAQGECSINATIKVREALVEKEPRSITQEIVKFKQPVETS